MKLSIASSVCSLRSRTYPVKDGFLDHFAFLQMLDHDSLQQLWSDTGIPYTFGIDHDDGPSCTNAETWSFAAFHPRGSEQQAFPLKQ